jgi:hypothetical protein
MTHNEMLTEAWRQWLSDRNDTFRQSPNDMTEDRWLKEDNHWYFCRLSDLGGKTAEELGR